MSLGSWIRSIIRGAKEKKLLKLVRERTELWRNHHRAIKRLKQLDLKIQLLQKAIDMDKEKNGNAKKQ